jgi:drug/metabolite transporter (DMT)-like permease
MKTYRRGIILTCIGTLFVSTSPVLTRIAKDLSSGQIAFFRLLFGSGFIYLISRYFKIDMTLKRRDVPKFILYGLITSLHFILYNGSINHTTFAHALCLVYTAPIMTTIISAYYLKEQIPKYKYIGIFIVIFGIVILAGFEPNLTRRMVLGDVMAVMSAFCLALYSIAGRREKDNYHLLKYVFWVYLLAALFSLPFAAKELTFSLSVKQWAVLILLGLLPTTIGHTLYNAGIRYIHPTYANLIITQEITGGIILGYLMLGEIPSTNSIIGAIIMFIGLFAVLIEKNSITKSAIG